MFHSRLLPFFIVVWVVATGCQVDTFSSGTLRDAKHGISLEFREVNAPWPPLQAYPPGTSFIDISSARFEVVSVGRRATARELKSGWSGSWNHFDAPDLLMGRLAGLALELAGVLLDGKTDCLSAEANHLVTELRLGRSLRVTATGPPHERLSGVLRTPEREAAGGR